MNETRNQSTKSALKRVSNWVQIFVMQRKSKWIYGSLGGLKARKHKKGHVEFWANRTNKAHSLWVEAHKDHWGKFQA